MKFIHLKDGIIQDWSVNSSQAQGKSVGEGNAHVLAVRKKAIELGVDMVIENDGPLSHGP